MDMDRKTIGMIMTIGGFLVGILIPFFGFAFLIMVIGMCLWWYD